jgi:hypothetical protein
MDLLDPKNDCVFKRLFADSPDLLAELISALRKDEPQLQVLQVLNPRILPEDLIGKPIELDVLARMRADPAAGRPTDSVGGAVANADADADESTAAPLNAWIAFLKQWKEAQEMSDLSYPPVHQAMKKPQDARPAADPPFRPFAALG